MINTKEKRPVLLSLSARSVVFLLGLGGPIVTWVLYMAGNHWKGGLGLILPIAVGYFISVFVAVLVHYCIKPFGWAVFAAVLLSVAMYVSAMAGAVLYESDPKALMWLPVALLFAGLNGAPMALIVSWAVIAAMRTNPLSGRAQDKSKYRDK